jgi:hypothetical protein
MTLVEWNVDPITGEKIFLSAGDVSLPTWFFFFTAAFTVMVSFLSLSITLVVDSKYRHNDSGLFV